MDIAEIRKKAKAQEKAVGLAGEPEKLQVLAPGSEIVEEQAGTTALVTAPEPPMGFEESPVTSQEFSDRLDQLFATTEDFVLVADASYADILDSQANSQAQNIRQYLAFHLGEEEYALDITRISEIIKVREYTDIPRAPEFVLGIISLRGVVVPVFDLRQRLGLGKSEPLSTSRIVVCQLGEVSVGLLVDSINQVVKLADDDIEPPPGVLSGLDREMVSGIGRYRGRMLILLNLHSALNVDFN